MSTYISAQSHVEADQVTWVFCGKTEMAGEFPVAGGVLVCVVLPHVRFLRPPCVGQPRFVGGLEAATRALTSESRSPPCQVAAVFTGRKTLAPGGLGPQKDVPSPFPEAHVPVSCEEELKDLGVLRILFLVQQDREMWSRKGRSSWSHF